MRVDARSCMNVFETSYSKYYGLQSLWNEWRRITAPPIGGLSCLSVEHIRIHHVTAGTPVSAQTSFEAIHWRCTYHFGRQTVLHIHNTICKEMLPLLSVTASLLQFILMSYQVRWCCFRQEKIMSGKVNVVYVLVGLDHNSTILAIYKSV